SSAPEASAVVGALDSPQSIAARVSAELERFLADKAGEFEAISPDATAIGQALIEFTRGGKRIRPVLAWCGCELAGVSVAPAAAGPPCTGSSRPATLGTAWPGTERPSACPRRSSSATSAWR